MPLASLRHITKDDIVGRMKAHEVAALTGALDFYAKEMQRFAPEDIDTPADARLADLRHSAAEGSANLAMVETVVAALPQAVSHDANWPPASYLFSVDTPREAGHLQALVLWTAEPDQGYMPRKSAIWPYYVIGKRALVPSYKGDRPKTRLLLASAVTDPAAPDQVDQSLRARNRLVVLDTWEEEGQALEVATEELIAREFGPADVERCFDVATGKIIIGTWRQSRHYTLSDGQYSRRRARKAPERLKKGEGMYTVDGLPYGAGLKHGVPPETLEKYDVLRHLAKLAFIFDKTEVLKEAAQAAIVADDQPALEAYVTSRPE